MRVTSSRAAAARLAATAIAVAFVLRFPVSAASFPEPEGLGAAKFGMTEGQVKARYPKMRLMPPPTPGQQRPAFALASYRLENQSVGSLRKCIVEFRFFRGADEAHATLYEVQFHCPDREQAIDYLQRQFGLATQTTDTSLMWIGKKAGVTLVPRSGVFSFDDLARSQTMQRTLLGYLIKMQRQVASTPTPQQ